MESSWAGSVAAFGDAARWFVDVAGRVGGRWEAPGLGEWDVRALVGHTSRSFLTVETYLATPAEEVVVETALDYYLATREIAAGPGVAERGVEAGRLLGEDPADAVRTIADRVLALVAERSGSELVTTIAGGMRLADYLPTRVFELAVHTCDLARALGEPLDLPAAPARHALAVASALSAHDGTGGELLLAVTGRTALPVGFSVM
ncbi:MAG: maleylpyruvate isomerase N-terminal domain-containing protein [Nocardioidaceae bacterium]